jgi:hypothetical protein
MQTAEEIAGFVERQPEMARLLRLVAQLELPDCWIGAGFIRNAVWDALHGRVADCALLNDVDVVFLDRADADASRDRAIELALAARAPGVPWSVKNQARMHVNNNEAPYLDARSAIARWPETATAVAARLANGRVELLAPHGIGDLVGLIVRPTPAFAARRDEVVRRVASKDWLARWPKLRIVD